MLRRSIAHPLGLCRTARVTVHPNLEKRVVVVEVVRQMDEILAMAAGQQGGSKLRVP